MKKLVTIVAASVAAASTATAGAVAYVAPEVTAMEEAAPVMGGSGGWLIPLVILAVLALALTQNDTPA